MNSDAEITALLNAANAGDAGAQDVAYGLVYGELKRRAERLRRATPGSSLSSTALVHELFLRLNAHPVAIRNRGHFYSLAARAMRQILVDYARRRCSLKRGGAADFASADRALEVGDLDAQQALELDAALTRLGDRDPDLVRVVEWHFFAGLSFKEIGEELDCHERTVRRD